jgi:predicted amidophosphoribosyltransferase
MPDKKKCMLCGKDLPLKGGICESCQERVRREALGEQANVRAQADKELKKHGVTPEPAKERK